MRREELLAALADALEAVAGASPTRVAVDGRDAAGKTTLADELAELLATRGREVVRASLDDFHRPPEERYARGEDSPDGYYEDAFDYDAVWRELLETPASEGAILLFDGVFLLRPELRDAWEVTVFVTVTPEETIRRARVRDAERFGSADAVERRYRTRYLPAHQRYDAEVDALRQVDLVVDNEDPANPSLVVRLQRAAR